jgi:hypothetical protein
MVYVAIFCAIQPIRPKAGDEVHLYVVPATNLSLTTVDRAKRPQQLGYRTHSGYERVREH